MLFNWLVGRPGTALRHSSNRTLERIVSRCPECAQAQRHPNRAGRISCPCGVVYDWPSGTTVLELIALTLICSETDRTFTLVQGRVNRRNAFPHRSIELTPERMLRERLSGTIDGRYTVDAIETRSLDFAEFDSERWGCPHCQPDGNATGYAYVSCGSCNAYVCSGTVVVRPNGRATFTCRPSCGTQGDLERSVQSIAVTGLNVARRASVMHAGFATRGHSFLVKR